MSILELSLIAAVAAILLLVLIWRQMQMSKLRQVVQ